jgi:hypothetical protein
MLQSNGEFSIVFFLVNLLKKIISTPALLSFYIWH